jgi:filamentous hemagglutinin family protein
MSIRRQIRSLCYWAAFLCCAGFGGPLQANPSGLTVVSGSATAKTSGSQLNVTVSSSAILNWSSFNIMSGETTSFLQPSAHSIVLNEIGGANPSKIWGTLTANGTVILANASGFYFGPNSMIKVGGNFIATTTPLLPDCGIGSSWTFTGMPPLASIVNYGQIAAGSGRGLYLIAEQIDNEGSLSAPGGQVGLYVGKSVLLSERPDGRGVSATVQIPAGTVDNNGKITANAGEIALNAQVVNQNGIIQADSVQNKNGVISLVASDQLNLGASSQILARGDDSPGGSPGGSVTLRSGNTFSDSVGSQITTTGGAQGGNGGNVEISARNILSLNSSMNAAANAGWLGGQLLLDPSSITLSTSGSGSAGNGTVDYNDGSGALTLNVNTAFANMNFSQITLQATGDITLAASTVWNLSTSTKETTGTLTLQAGGDIVFGNKSEILDANDWSVNLQAGVSFPGGTVQSGTGNIFLNGGSGGTGNGTVQTAAGSITMTAGESIEVASGAIRTTGGGSINLNALAGDINGGTGNVGYTLSGQYGYTVGASPTAPPLVGGIATTAGGDVTLTAGDDIICSPNSKVNSGQTPGASGAYSSSPASEPGNVTLTAGNEVMGNFTVANGTGTILAGASVQSGQPPQILNANATIGTSTAPVTLSLIDGSWNVFSGGNIYISQVYNPNGTYNANSLGVNFLGAPNGAFTGNIGNPTVPASITFLFNYAPNAAANLWAGDGITLTGASLPKDNNAEMDPVYPPVLTLNAGAGGIAVNTTICLYPSSQGGLQITTRDGGNLSGTQQQTTLTGIVMSDSGLPGYSTFLSGHALTPLYENNPNPVTLNISGDIDSFGLTVPTFAQITVAGNTYNFGFLGQNVSPLQTTFINVGGNVTYRGDQTGVSLTDPLPASMFSPTLSGDPAATSLLSYNATTGTLTYIGQMTEAELTYLLNPTVVVLNSGGQPQLNPDGTPVTKPLTLDATQQAAIQALYTASQNATLGDQGLALAGPGQFNISAASMDLGVSGGISVLAPDSALAAISPYGAGLNINLSGNLEMTATKIANNGLLGNINVTSGGTLDVGGEFTPYGDPNSPKGIFTTSGGNISVSAQGDVNIDGSRIAAYNGGNITVFSRSGNVNAGTGGSGFVNVTAEQLNGTTGQLSTISESIPGSGILATTLFGSDAQLGNITVNTPDGSINASLGGIIQIAFNGANSHDNFIALTAGQNINASGSGVIGSNIRLKAGGDITGLVVGTQSVNINSQQNVAVTVVSAGNVDISASGSVTGLVIGGSGVNVSGESITAALESTSVTTTGNASGANTGVPQSNVAHDNTTVMEDTSTNVTRFAQQSIGDNKKDKPITLTQRTGRVTVILPAIK